MILTREEEAMAEGRRGPGIQRCMEILIKFGEAFGAERMVPIASAHTMPKEPPELLVHLTEGVERAGVFTTLHSLMSAFSPRTWKPMGLPEDFAVQEATLFEERAACYRRIGFCETYTCLPMLVGNFIKQRDFISWIGTGAQLLANSLVGARCNRDGTVVNLAAAITGRAPYQGLFLDENRLGQVLVRLEGIDPSSLSPVQLGAVGYHLGAIAGSRNVVIQGLPSNLELERLKYLIAPLAVTGSVGICHIVGLTPEAPTLEAAFGGRPPQETIVVGRGEIRSSLSLYAGDGETVDMVLFGCPHCTIPELAQVARLLEHKHLADGKRLWIGLPHQHYCLAENLGYARAVESAGGVFASSCMATIPDAPVPEGVKVIATNSFKAAHYISRLTQGKVKLLVGEMAQCIDAVTGNRWKGINP